MKKCVECKAEAMRPAAIRSEHKVGGFTLAGDVSGFECTKCGAKYLSGPSLGRFELEAAARVAALGARDGASMRFIRKALGLKASELAELLGVAAETVSRWENDSLPIEPRWFALLAALADDRLAGRERVTAALRRSGPAPVPNAPPVDVGPVLSRHALELMAYVQRGGYSYTLRADAPSEPTTELAIMELLGAGLVRHRAVESGAGQWRIILEPVFTDRARPAV